MFLRRQAASLRTYAAICASARAATTDSRNRRLAYGLGRQNSRRPEPEQRLRSWIPATQCVSRSPSHSIARDESLEGDRQRSHGSQGPAMEAFGPSRAVFRAPHEPALSTEAVLTRADFHLRSETSEVVQHVPSHRVRATSRWKRVRRRTCPSAPSVPYDARERARPALTLRPPTQRTKPHPSDLTAG